MYTNTTFSQIMPCFCEINKSTIRYICIIFIWYDQNVCVIYASIQDDIYTKKLPFAYFIGLKVFVHVASHWNITVYNGYLPW